MADDLTAKLHSTTDAMVWAKEFCDLFAVYRIERDGDGPGHDEITDAVGLMVGWFTNAIEVGGMHERERHHRDFHLDPLMFDGEAGA